MKKLKVTMTIEVTLHPDELPEDTISFYQAHPSELQELFFFGREFQADFEVHDCE